MKLKDNHILVIDDEEAILDMFCDYFGALSYKITTVKDAEEAIRLINKDDGIDLIITDIDLPGLSGIDVLKIVRENKPEVPVIIITGLKTLDFAISAVKHGAHDYITKPFDLGEVRKIVEKVLRYRTRSQKKEQIYEYTSSMNVNFDIPTKDLDAAVFAAYMSKFLYTCGFCDKDGYHQFYLAFMETLINALEHGNLELPSSIKENDFEKIALFEEMRGERINDPHYGNRLVKIAFRYNPTRFSLTIVDEGPGFEWRKYLSDTHQMRQPLTAAYGRGFMLIHHIIDEVYFNERGNSITLVKTKN